MVKDQELSTTELFNHVIEHEFSDAHGHALKDCAPWVELRKRMEVDSDHTYVVDDGWAEVYTGRQFRYREPTADMVHIVDIAESLGKTARYAGHTRTFYSVAEHSCLMMLYARREWPKMTDKTLLTILMHDASEAYITDVPKPLKHLLPRLKAFEETVDELIAEKYDLHFPLPSLVKELDARIVCDERAQAMNPSDNEWGVDALEPLGVKLEFWAPAYAVQHFLHYYSNLTGQ